MQSGKLLLLAFGFCSVANAGNKAFDYRSVTANSSAPIFSYLSEEEEAALDSLLVRLYGNYDTASSAKVDLFKKLVDQKKINSSITRSGSDCVDTIKPSRQ